MVIVNKGTTSHEGDIMTPLLVFVTLEYRWTVNLYMVNSIISS